MNTKRKTLYNLKRADAGEWFSSVIKCQYACPVHTNVPAYLKLLREGDFERAYRVNRYANLFPAILGRVCTHPCETACRRGRFDEPVSICALKRATADYSEKGTELPLGLETITEKQGKKVAIIGSGPAGLACANDLALRGYDVVIYEALDRIGGMLNVGIPPYRLPRKLIQQEISRVMSALGVEIKLNTPIGEKLTLGNLRKEYDAIFIAAGAHKPVKLGIEGENLKGVIHGVTFMRKANLGESLEMGRKVAVIGGGNTAMDCARTALRLKADKVYLVYRRTRAEMPVVQQEVEETEEEGIEIFYLTSPVRILTKDSETVSGLECIKNKLGEPDASGRKRPIPIEGSNFILDVDTVIPAVSQAPDLSFLGKDVTLEVSKWDTLVVNPETLETNQPGIFTGGDFVTGPRVLIEAIAQGHTAAQSIHGYLIHGEVPQKRARFRVVKDYKPPNEYDTLPRGKPCTRPVNERSGFDTEVDLGLSKEAIQRDAMRCFQCRLNIVIDSKKCILCGGCVDVCPNECIRMVSLSRVKGLENSPKKGSVLVLNEERCMRCGLCVRRCPTKAIRMVEFTQEESN
ncbi:MAG: FAD-dependent oxidoreductase [Candidatus Brocadiales bacterium]|nr:FAD-dependent oxidoreductase [Candidatus Brocadiales bacterium]